MKIYVDGNPVDVEIYVDSTKNTMSLVTGDKKTSVSLMKIYGNAQGLGQSLLDHILMNSLGMAPLGAVANSSETPLKTNKHIKPL